MQRKLKNLATLMRLSKNLVTNQKKVLADLYARETAVISSQERLIRQFDEETKKMTQLAIPYTHYPAYRQKILDKQKLMENQLRTIRQDITRQQELIAETYRELKRYEIAHDRTAEDIRKELEKKEQERLDEVALQKHNKTFSHRLSSFGGGPTSRVLSSGA